MLDAIRQPWSRLLHGASRRTADGKLYVGQGQPVMVFPVFGGGPGSTARLRNVLDQAGFTSYDWGQGVDKGPGALGLNHCLRQRPPVPCTSVYSMSDRAVPWQMCLESESLMSENILVPAVNHTHLGNHPKVLEVITHRLAQPEAAWRPFDA